MKDSKIPQRNVMATEALSAEEIQDPNDHLHNENYDSAFHAPVIDSKSLIFSSNRKSVSLNGEWSFVLDAYDEGLRCKWFEYEITHPKTWLTPLDYEADIGQKVQIPSCFNTYNERYWYYEGASWFTRFFEHAKKDGEKVFLHLRAVAYQARIFLNGEFLGVHKGASTGFHIELKNIKNGTNRLQIEVDNRRLPDRVPMQHTDWFSYGGIYREVELLCVPNVFIKKFTASLVPNGKFNELQFHVEVEGVAEGTAKVEIPSLNVNASIEIKNGIGSVCVESTPQLWSPESPCLYEVFASFGQDQISEKVGFREIKVIGENIVLNGKPVWLRGISSHEEFPQHGKMSTEADVRLMFEDAKALGCNFMRLAHYPHHDRAAKIADEVGMLLWEEIPVYWAIQFTNEKTYEDAENQLLELIQRDVNRASVIIWGVGNENKDTDERYKFMSSLANKARQTDSTRLVSAACLVNHVKNAIEDRLMADLDVVGLNEYFGWYNHDFDELTALLENSAPGKPVIITETGADAVPGFFGDKGELFTENHQADVYTEQIKRIKKAKYIRGMTPWILYDFPTERRQNRYQNGWNQKGLIARDHKTRKQAFQVLADFYNEQKEL
ncbi:glycoside hydrolase family 2 protein [Silvimonas soli]|uniref:glycoside hydrolase family 2 protein n=1 Tax=Silvimonas soli TaxID=2980100 RepID=UPI0024B32EAC|nr:glycoside hydrolase family 2 TIM barrel-domain containing protein [Silvimonas soli]